jgi:hypothetical protein
VRKAQALRHTRSIITKLARGTETDNNSNRVFVPLSLENVFTKLESNFSESRVVAALSLKNTQQQKAT